MVFIQVILEQKSKVRIEIPYHTEPFSVALSQVHYVKNRKDHYLHSRFKSLSLDDALLHIFEAKNSPGPLWRRYESMMIWAIENDARVVDYDDIIENPLIFASLIGVQDVNDANLSKALDMDTHEEKSRSFRRENFMLNFSVTIPLALLELQKSISFY